MISIIIPTLGRDREIDSLLRSIVNYSYGEIEVIIVDQNRDDRLDKIVFQYKNDLLIKHLKVKFKGASKARNYGFNFSSGDIINFPDDDSEFSQDTLMLVNEFLDSNKDIDVVSGRTVDKKTNKASVTKFYEDEKLVDLNNLYRTTVECTLFFRRNVFEKISGFDERLGVGTYFGAEEGADLVLRMLYENYKIVYKPNIFFYHPEKIQNYDEKEIIRARNYSRGFGAMSAKHIISLRKKSALKRFIIFNFRTLGGVILNLSCLNTSKSKYYLEVIKGRFIGFYKMEIMIRNGKKNR